MTNKTSVTVEWDVDEQRGYSATASLRRLWWELTSAHSSVNLRTHLTFIELAGPERGQWRIKLRFIAHRMDDFARRSFARNIPGVDTLVAIVRRRRTRKTR
jgi:hypothetical protein